MAGQFTFNVPKGMIDARDVDLDATFAGVDAQVNLNNLERSNRINGMITSGLGALNGISGILSPAFAASKTRETPVFNSNLNAIRAAGTMDYSNYNQLMRSYNDFNNSIGQDYTVVRGMNDGQKIGTIGSSALSGAMTLGSIVPGIGHAAGAAIGGAIGAFGVATGDTIAYNNTRTDNNNVRLAQYDASLNTVHQADKLADSDYRFAQTHVAKNGGQIQREQETLEHFANRVLGRKGSILPKRTMCKGGVMVKIRTK